MSWSETMFEVQQFYNVLDLKNKIDGIINDDEASDASTYSSNKIEEKLKNAGGGTGTLNTEFVESVDKLPSEPDSDTIYLVEDDSAVVTEIDDENVSENTTYSSKKITELIDNIETGGGGSSSGGNASIDDVNSSTSTTYSSNKIDSLLGVTLTGTLSIGDTEVTITNEKITTDSMIDIYTDNFSAYPTAVTTSDGSITLTFDAQVVDVNIKVVVR
jgi:hypothetical protein